MKKKLTGCRAVQESRPLVNINQIIASPSLQAMDLGEFPVQLENVRRTQS